MLKASHSPAITGTRRDQDGENAQQNEPECLIKEWLEREAKAGAGVIPDSVSVACDDPKRIRAGRKSGVVGGAASTGVDPVQVEPLESIPKQGALRYQQAQCRVMELPLVAAGTHLEPLCQR